MRLPTKLAFTAFHIAVAGTLACSAKTDGGTDHAADAAPDVPMEATADAAGDVATDVGDSAVNDVAPRDAVSVDTGIVDAATDVPSEGGDECTPNYYCGSATADAECPGPVCDLSECPLDAGCEPYV